MSVSGRLEEFVQAVAILLPREPGQSFARVA